MDRNPKTFIHSVMAVISTRMHKIFVCILCIYTFLTKGDELRSPFETRISTAKLLHCDIYRQLMCGRIQEFCVSWIMLKRIMDFQYAETSEISIEHKSC